MMNRYPLSIFQYLSFIIHNLSLKKMKITVLTPDREVFQGDITSVKVPGTGGQFQVLKNHAPVVSSLSKGEVTIAKTDGGKMKFTIEKGFIEVLNNEVSLLVQGVKE